MQFPVKNVLNILAGAAFLLLLSCTDDPKITTASTQEVVEETHPDGTPKAATQYRSGQVIGQVEYYENGVKKLEGSVNEQKQRVGEWKFWFRNGVLNSVYNYNGGKRHGMCTIYYDNGFKRFEGRFRNDKRVEMWYFWRDDGKVDLKVDYKKGDSTPVEYPQNPAE